MEKIHIPVVFDTGTLEVTRSPNGDYFVSVCDGGKQAGTPLTPAAARDLTRAFEGEIDWRDMFGRYLAHVVHAEGVDYLEREGFDDEGETFARWTEAEWLAIKALRAELPSVR